MDIATPKKSISRLSHQVGRQVSEKALEPASCHDMPPPSTNIVHESALNQAYQESLNRVDL